MLAETDLDAVLDTIASHAPSVCVIDSVQTLRCAELSGAPGSVGQVREVAARIMDLAKARSIAVVLVGHVTKDGALAGPRVLEHLVDCVLQFEGERERPYRELRALKNRFGSTNEAGLFEMRQGGLVEVLDASARFVAEATRAPGSVVLAAMEGSRPLLVEVQALVAPSELEQPRRVVSGLDRNRLALVLAILGRHGGSASAATTCSSTSLAACAWTSPGWTWRSRWRSPRRPRGGASGRELARTASACPVSAASASWASPASCVGSATPSVAWPRPPDTASRACTRPPAVARGHARRPRCARRWWRRFQPSRVVLHGPRKTSARGFRSGRV